MVPVKIFEHILATLSELPIRPIVLLAGDDRQLPPIEKIDGKIQSNKTVMTSSKLTNITVKILLTVQHRSEDEYYSGFLQHVRLWCPSEHLLNEIQAEKTLYTEDSTDEELLKCLQNFPTSTVITVSHNAANRINNVVLNSIFDSSSCLGYVNSDCDLGRIPVYQGMKVMITQNRDKRRSVVNGRVASVLQMQGKTVFLKLANNSVVQVYPVSFPGDDGVLKTVVPFMPAYALTIPKIQGETLNHCIVWLDSPVIAPGGAYVALSRCKTLHPFYGTYYVLPSYTCFFTLIKQVATLISSIF